MGLGLNISGFWFLHFSEAPMTFIAQLRKKSVGKIILG
jgi:hypothetical protein